MSTPWLNLVAGGGLIGLSAAVLILMNGKVAGISGVAGEILQGRVGEQGWRLWFLAGLLFPAILPGVLPAVTTSGSPVLLGIAGVLVGLGTGIGSGCTSGHGVCGNANLSPRSLVATLTFMTTAAITVFIVRHVAVWGN